MWKHVVEVVVATGAGIALLGGCAGTENSGAAESLADYIGYSPLANEHERALAAAESNKLTDEEKRRKRAIEDFVVSCMRDEGFEYVPQYPEDLDNGPPSQIDLKASMSQEQFAKQYGYGLYTIPYSPPDPNMTMRDGLSPEAQKAFDQAEWGDDGCRAKADKKVNDNADAEQLQIETEFKDLAEDISRLHQRLRDDPRIREALTRWADCMADGGYPGLEQAVDASNLVGERAGSSDLTTLAPEKLREVQTFERAIAVVDLACQQEHIEPVRAEVATRLEKQFVAEHKAELERFRDRAGDSGVMLGGPA